MVRPKWKILPKGVQHTTCEFTGMVDYCYQVKLLDSEKLIEVNINDAKKFNLKEKTRVEKKLKH